jgi:hypothetical protein
MKYKFARVVAYSDMLTIFPWVKFWLIFSFLLMAQVLLGFLLMYAWMSELSWASLAVCRSLLCGVLHVTGWAS